MASFITTMWDSLPRFPNSSKSVPVRTNIKNTWSASSVADQTQWSCHRPGDIKALAATEPRRTGRDSDSEDRNARTRGQFKPRHASKGTNSYHLRQFAEATLGSGSLRRAVQLPEGEDLNEWLAVNIVDFYNQINLLYGAITEFCSPQSCPEMKATDEYVEEKGLLMSKALTGGRFEYLWQDNESFKRPTKMPAPQYVEHLMTWVQSNIDNEQIFPSKIGMGTGLSPADTSLLCHCRCRISQDIPPIDPSDVQAPVPSLRAHLLPSLPSRGAARPGAAPEHKL